MTDFKALLETLADAGVEFILVGGLAAIAHGSSRLTQDVDIVYSRAEQNIARLAEALSEHQPYPRGAPPGLPFQWQADTVLNGLNFTLQTRLGDIDLFGEITGGGRYEDLIPHCLTLKIFNRSIPCLGLDKLLEVKRAAGRPKDLEAIAELEALRESPSAD